MLLVLNLNKNFFIKVISKLILIQNGQTTIYIVKFIKQLLSYSIQSMKKIVKISSVNLNLTLTLFTLSNAAQKLFLSLKKPPRENISIYKLL